MSPARSRGVPTGVSVTLTTLKVMAIAGGLGGTIVCLMALVGLLYSNLWGQLVPALLVGVGVPLVVVERLSHDRKGRLRTGLASDVLALVWLGFTLIFVVLAFPVTRSVLAREAQVFAEAGAVRTARVVAFMARSQVDLISEEVDVDVSDAGVDDGGGTEAEGGAGELDAGFVDAAIDGDGEIEPPPVPTEELPRLAPAALLRRIAPSLVTISVRRSDRTTRSGTGFVIDRHGLVVTAAWVMDDASAAAVRLPDGSWCREVALVARDLEMGLALLSIETEVELVAVRLGEAEETVPGDGAYVVANPLGLTPLLQEGEVRAFVLWLDRHWLVVSIPATAATFGGPVVSERGEVLGVQIPAPASAQGSGEGSAFGLAVPSSALAALRGAALEDPDVLDRGSLRPLVW